MFNSVNFHVHLKFPKITVILLDCSIKYTFLKRVWNLADLKLISSRFLGTIWTCQQKLFIFFRNCLTVSDFLCSKKYIFLVHCPRANSSNHDVFEFNPKKRKFRFWWWDILRFLSMLIFIDYPFHSCIFIELIFSYCPISVSKPYASYQRIM